MHSYVLPSQQSDYRCPACGLSWSRSGEQAVCQMPEAAVTIEAVDTWFTCCEGYRFRWLRGVRVKGLVHG